MENARSAKIAKKENKGQEDALEAQTESALPAHRVRAVKPLHASAETVTNHSHKLYSQQQ